MSQVTLEMRDGQKAFRPGEAVSGAAFWKLERAPKSAEVRLFWRTRGKGTEDVSVVDTVRYENPQSEEARLFRFQAPDGPYSFSGRLIALIWGLELVVEPSESIAQVEITLSPTGQEVLLGQK
jgi:hypothetical protein